MSAFEITLFEGDDSLSKKIWLEASGKLLSKPACAMTSGAAKRLRLGDAPTIALEALKRTIEDIKPNQAITLGVLRPDLPDAVKVVTAKNLNGHAGIIARTQEHLHYSPGQPGFLLFDHDTKTMPVGIVAAIESAGGFWPALVSVVPELDGVGSLVRSSTSAGLYRKDTGEKLPGSANLHCFVPVLDASDNERTMRNIQDRCWLAGLAWYSLGKAGQLLERSIIDAAVGTPERLVFEGGPIIVPPLAQDRADRTPLLTPGGALDTRSACQPLNALETAKLR
jgi:hypothetical protein